MSVKTRLDDAQLLYENGRLEGALLSVLIAIAATSRKRYPKDKVKTDKDAFTKFIRDEFKAITVGATKGKWWYDGNILVAYRKKRRIMPLEDFLYKFMRNELVHEAGLPEDITFNAIDGFCISMHENGITFSVGFFEGLRYAVLHAQENTEDFRDENSTTSE